MEKAEYFVYCDFFITHLWMERFAQIPKGEFLEVPYSLNDTQRIPYTFPRGKRSAVAVVNDSPVDCQSRDGAARRRRGTAA